MSDYDQEVAAIEAHNQPILEDFTNWLEAAGLSAKTVRKHRQNITLFAMYLVYYDPLNKLDEAGSGDVYMYLCNWFPRKVWASPGTIRSNMASLRRFFKFMVQSGRIDEEYEKHVRATLNKNKDTFIESSRRWQ